MKRYDNLDMITKIQSVSDEEQLIESVLSQHATLTLGFVNQHGFNLCSDPALLNNFMDLDVLLRDGIGMKMAMSLFERPPGNNMNGTDLIPRIVAKAQQQPLNVMAFGTEDPWLSKGVSNLGLDELCSVKHHGFETIDHYVSLFQRHHSDGQLNLVILAMGMPKQEQLASEIKKLNLSRTVVICGGAVLDFQANKVKRAPSFFRKTGLEWAYRLGSEPKRMFRRYVIGIPVFFSHLLALKTQTAFNR
ncbi:WecB/TagA/CpsF family glycosyltransferase [Vibrio ulleungensis]|uniref:WecB/TagA/CpsF family glycosyltransferase n=1 Tax=Vibrio ulleungensis TaxID=2807619 RepID=A0ABS2HKD6_9VIBR|nr:WecB/TagA/CpsF family glycosyltransferase [Vibrio ulleungensis]MBM7036286.1 WecB/TagA/CpsF family glycosyltransferase [Vibrio ulleungensis]